MKKLVINNKEKHTILEMHKSMGYKSMISETMDISDIETQSALDDVMKELNVPSDVVPELESCGIPQQVGKWENVLTNATVEELKKAYKEVTSKIKTVNEQAETAIVIAGTTISLPMALLGLLALGILTALITRLTSTKRTGYRPRRNSACRNRKSVLRKLGLQ